MNIRFVISSAALAGALVLSQGALAQRPQGAPPREAPKSAQESAPIDLTGYWVSVVTEDWRWRMLTPPHGDYASVPLNAAGKKLADEFDPALYGGANFETSQIIDCRAYGAAGLMRMPIRVHVTWADPNTLKIESDWGQQTREIHFLPGRPTGVNMMGDDTNMPPPGAGGGQGGGQGGQAGAQQNRPAPSPQGTSIAIWQVPYEINSNEGARGVQRRGGFGGPAQAPLPGGDLRVVTFNMTPGWLRRNGVPYGARTRMVEYYQTFTDPTGKKWFDVTTDVEDPEYLNAPFITSDDFRSEPDASNWQPHPCKQVAQD
jgi:hypothetical protein